MEKEENPNQENTKAETSNEEIEVDKQPDDKQEEIKEVEEKVELSPEEKIIELEDKLARTFAEMENQRRRFEKEKDDAFDYGGFAFAKEALNLIDNLARSLASHFVCGNHPRPSTASYLTSHQHHRSAFRGSISMHDYF